MHNGDLLQDIAAFIRTGTDVNERDRLAQRLLQRQFKRWKVWGRINKVVRTKKLKPGLGGFRPFPVQLYREYTDQAMADGRIFETSGTTGSQPGRVPYSAADLMLMEAAIDRNAHENLFGSDTPTTHMLVLAPPPTSRPGMIMAHGMQRLGTQFCQSCHFFVGPAGVDVPTFLAQLRAAADARVPVTLAGGSFAFINIADKCIESGMQLQVPAGSRILDAGGTKGRSREVTRPEFRELMEQAFGIPADWQSNLLGMTELASQFYDHRIGTVRTGVGEIKRNPIWTRTWAVSPETLEPLPDRTVGLLVHLDLANFDHPALILTEDIGCTSAGGFEIMGRAHGSELRGCSLLLENFQTGVVQP